MASRARDATRWEVDDYLSYLLARASHLVASEFHREVRAAGLTVLEWRVLAILSDGRARKVGELAAIALAQQSTVTKLLGRMQAEKRLKDVLLQAYVAYEAGGAEAATASLASIWGVSDDFVRRLFLHETGVVAFFKHRPGKRTCRVLRVPRVGGPACPPKDGARPRHPVSTVGYALPNDAVICSRAGKQERGIQT